MKKIFIWVGVSIGITALVTAGVVFFLKTKRLELEIEQNRLIRERFSENIASLEEEKRQTQGESEKLNSELVSYLAANNKLRDENKFLKQELGPLKENLESKSRLLEKLKTDIKVVEEELVLAKNSEATNQAKLKELKQSVIGLQESLDKERNDFCYNLGVAYTKARMYDEAIMEYEKALALDPDNAEANYNLGIIYHNVKKDQDKAVVHYRRYLEILPDSEDAGEVESWIRELTGMF